VFPGALESESPNFRILLVFWIQFLETGLFLASLPAPSRLFSIRMRHDILCLLVGSLHQTNRSPASRSSSVNAWDVFRVENLALEGFSNEVQYEVLEVPGSICLFAFLAPRCHTSATLQTNEPRLQHRRDGPDVRPQPEESLGSHALLRQPLVGRE